MFNFSLTEPSASKGEKSEKITDLKSIVFAENAEIVRM